MAATENDLIGVKNSQRFQFQAELSVMKFAEYVCNNVASYTAKKIHWAYEVVTNQGRAASVAQQIADALVQDPIFTNQNSGLDYTTMLNAVTDSQFQAAVENAVNTTILAA